MIIAVVRESCRAAPRRGNSLTGQGFRITLARVEGAPTTMPKYLIQASYTSEGIRGLITDSASGRRADVTSAVKSLGGSVEAFYYAFGSDDVILIVEMPDNVTAAAVGLTAAGSGTVKLRTTPLLTVEDVDKALEIKLPYRPPGK